MSDTAEFILKLNNQVSGPARDAANALRGVADKVDTATRRMGLAQIAAQKMNQQFAEAPAIKAAKALADHARAAAKVESATRRMGLAQLQASKMNADMDKKKTFLGGLRAALPFRSIADYASGAFVGELAAKGVEHIIGGFVEGAKAAVDLVAEGVKMAFHDGGKAENLRLSYKLLLGAKGGKGALDDISGFAGKTKYDDDAIAEMMRPLFNAGLRGKGARSAFAASGDLEAAGLGPAQEFIDQFAKIQLKGGVTEKLLVGMGINIRDFKTALAEETHTKDKEGAFKKATEGKGDPQSIMNAIFRGIESRQGGKIGTGTEAASKTMSARLGKIADLPSQYLKKMSESPAWQTLSDKLGDTLKGLDPDSPRGAKIIASLFRVFDRLSTWIAETLTPENFDAFAAGAATAIEVIGKLPSILESVYRISRDVAMIWGGVRLLTGVTGFVTALNAAMGATAATGLAVGAGGAGGTAAVFSGIGSAALAAVAPLVAMAAAMGALYLAYSQISKTVDELGGIKAVGNDLLDFIADPMAAQMRMAGAGKADAEMDQKYGGAGYRLKAPTVAQANAGLRTGTTVHVDQINVVAPEGADAKEHAAAVGKGLEKHLGRSLERAATQGGG